MSTGLVTKNFRNLGKCAKNLDMPNAAPLCETNQEQYLKGNERRRTPQNAAFLYKYNLLKVSKLSMGGKTGKYSKPHAPA